MWVEQFVRTHDVRVWQCLCDILKIPEDFVGNLHKEAATLPLSPGGPWFKECGANQCARPLGKLGGRLTHDQRQAPRLWQQRL